MGGESSPVEEVERLLQRGDPLLAYDRACHADSAALDAVDGARLGYLRALALARSGATERAAVELAGLVVSDAAMPADLVEDTAALHARLSKDRALAMDPSTQREGFARAAEQYEAVFRHYGRPYSAVNAATMRFLAGNRDEARTLAEATLALLGDDGPTDDYWRAASRAEAHLALGDLDVAARWLEIADRTAPDEYGDRSTTLKQLRLLCAAQGLSDDLLGPLGNPDVVHYCGHRISPPGGSGQFPSDDEARVAAEIQQALAARRVGWGHGSLAAGADVIVAEALLAIGAELHVALPFSVEEFVETSVRPSGDQWVSRFQRCLEAASSVVVTCDSAYMGDDALYGYAGMISMGQALNRSHSLSSPVWQLAVWDGNPTGLPAGTAHDVSVWSGAGGTSHVVSVGGPPRIVPAPPPADVVVQRRPVRAVLFGDLRGFSSLRDEHLTHFIDGVLPILAEVLDRHDSVLDRNTWGDGLFVALRDAASAAECALDLQHALDGIDMEGLGLPQMQMRLSAHAGPVLAGTDPIRGVSTVFGRELTRGARIEPLTPPGAVYASAAFASLLRVAPGAGVVPEYVGRITTAKDFETVPMYVLRRQQSS
ncbi:MAG TPA: adenylate/guanylate cyclase domain-containing protein [Acidimicrobiales bacterium]